MIFLVYSDLQAAEGSSPCFHNPSIPLQRWRVDMFYQSLHTIYRNLGADGLIDLGDTFDRRDAIDISTIDTVLRGLEPFASGTNLKLQGNHDQKGKTTLIHNGRLFRSLFEVFNGDVTTKYIRNTCFVMAAFPASYDNCAQQLRKVIQAKKRRGEKVCVLGHFTVKGCTLNSGEATDGIPLSVLEDADLVLLGDIHKPQSLAPHVHYVGSPFQQNFGEAGENKRVALLDSDTLSLEWIPIKNFPVYRKVSVDEFVRLASEDSEDRYRVVIRSHEESELFQSHPLSVRHETVFDYEISSNQVSDQPKWSTESAMKQWTERFPPESKGIPVTPLELLELGHEIITP